MVNLWSCLIDNFVLKWYPCISILTTRKREQKTVLQRLFSLQWTTHFWVSIDVKTFFSILKGGNPAWQSSFKSNANVNSTIQWCYWSTSKNSRAARAARIFSKRVLRVCNNTWNGGTQPHNSQSSILNFYFLTHPTNTDAEYFTCNIWRYSCVNFYKHEKGSPGNEKFNLVNLINTINSLTGSHSPMSPECNQPSSSIVSFVFSSL